MKISILVENFPPKWIGGMELATYNIARFLAKKGHEVHVITSCDDQSIKESVERGFYVHRVRHLRPIGILFYWINTIVASIKTHPDVVHCQGLDIGIIGLLISKLIRKPYVVWAQGNDIYIPWFFSRPFFTPIIKNANAVIALTDDMKYLLQKYFDRDIHVIPNGVDLAKFENISHNSIRQKLNASSDERFLIFVGRFRPEKGLCYLIEAMSFVNKTKPLITLILVGDGPEECNLRNLIKKYKLADHIIFLGKLSSDLVPHYMAAADLFILPSLSEGLPLVILEAMASGLPIVATNVRGLPEIVKNGENGLLVEPRNPKAIAMAILQLLENNPLRAYISNNNKLESKKYDWTIIASRLEKLYASSIR